MQEINTGGSVVGPRCQLSIELTIAAEDHQVSGGTRTLTQYSQSRDRTTWHVQM